MVRSDYHLIPYSPNVLEWPMKFYLDSMLFLRCLAAARQRKKMPAFAQDALSDLEAELQESELTDG